jgi:hypothetical protein
MLSEDGWKLLSLTEDKFLIDTDTLHVFGNCNVSFQYDKGEHATHVKLQSDLEGAELDTLYDDMLAYSKQVRADMNSHYDKTKVEELNNQSLSNLMETLDIDSMETLDIDSMETLDIDSTVAPRAVSLKIESPPENELS